MDVKVMPMLPHNHMEEIKNQENHLLSVISMAKTAKQDEADSLPPLHSLMARLDAVQGLRELETFNQESPRPAFVVDFRSKQQELSIYAQDAFKVELNSL